MSKTGRPPNIPPQSKKALRKVIQEHPQATLSELAMA